MRKEKTAEIVAETLRQLQERGLIVKLGEVEYAAAREILKAYYKGNQADAEITQTLESIKGDPYYNVLPLSFLHGKTTEDIAELMGADRTTISRNKKRLCLLIYSRVGGQK